MQQLFRSLAQWPSIKFFINLLYFTIFMETEQDDIARYINLFGFNPRYGEPRPRIASITYRPQSFDRSRPLYLK